MKTLVEVQIELNLKRKIQRLELQANFQKDLGNSSRAKILFLQAKKLKKELNLK